MASEQIRETLNMRVLSEDRALFDRAAKIMGKNRTQFMLDAARKEASDALLDHTWIELDPDAFTKFAARLDAPAQPNDRLATTLHTELPWE